ncbi:MAG: hypothetical protein J0L93_04440 [Deltaproteobacteria bacterium]|nr:hypothetical protein [Deltaproteobacteria bacterium]
MLHVKEIQSSLFSSSWGIEPRRLIDQVNNTAPFIFDDKVFAPKDQNARFDYIKILRAQKTSDRNDLTMPDYFLLCLTAHFATVATFVPTDLDPTIRLKLWRQASAEEILEMSKNIFQFYRWDDSLVSRKSVTTNSGKVLTGHMGEWLTIAIPALVSCKKYSESKDFAQLADEIESTILSLLEFHRDAFDELLSMKQNSALDILRASSVISHNLGDLDRVIDIWIPEENNLFKSKIYKLGINRFRNFESLYLAGEINKTFMANENHRHYSLREARALRLSADFLLPIGPFFESWGEKLTRHPQLTREDLFAILEVLVSGWEKLNRDKPVFGYARAIAGILSASGRNASTLIQNLPSSKRKIIEAGNLREMLSISGQRFEASLAGRLLKMISR